MLLTSFLATMPVLLFRWLYRLFQTFFTSHCITSELWRLYFLPSKLLNLKKAESWSYKIPSPASRGGAANICPAEFHQWWTSQLPCVFHALPYKWELLVGVSSPLYHQSGGDERGDNLVVSSWIAGLKGGTCGHKATDLISKRLWTLNSTQQLDSLPMGFLPCGEGMYNTGDCPIFPNILFFTCRYHSEFLSTLNHSSKQQPFSAHLHKAALAKVLILNLSTCVLQSLLCWSFLVSAPSISSMKFLALIFFIDSQILKTRWRDCPWRLTRISKVIYSI